MSHQFENSIRRAIRDIYALDSLITDVKLLETLQKRFDHSFAWRYIDRLRKKVKVEMTPDLDREKVENAVMDVRETFRLAQEDMLPIAYGQTKIGEPPVKKSERLQAWRTIALLKKMKLELEFELGIYRNIQSTNPDAFRFTPIPDEIKKQMLETFRAFRLPPGITRKIEPVRVIDVEVKDLSGLSPIEAPGGKQTPISGMPMGKPTAINHGIKSDPEF